MNAQSSQRPNRPSATGPQSGSEMKTGASQNPGSSGVRHRTRAERVAAHFTYSGLFQQLFDGLRNIEIRKQVIMVALATLAMCIATQAWTPPFPYSEFEVADRDIVCRVAFTFREERPLFPMPHLPTIDLPEASQEVSLPSVAPDEMEAKDFSVMLPDENTGLDIPPHQQTLTEQPTSFTEVNTEHDTTLVPEIAIAQEDSPDELSDVSEKTEHISTYIPGTTLVKAGQVLSRRDIRILYEEYQEMILQHTWREFLARFSGVYFLTLALFYLAIVFLHRRERRRPQTTRGTAFLYSLMVVTVIAASFLHGFVTNGANMELIPTLLFAQGVAVAFSWELALILTAIISFVFVLSQAHSIFTMVLLVGVSASVVIHLGRLRNRTKLVAVGSFGALIAFLLTLFIQMTQGQEITSVILTFAVYNAFWTCVASVLMTALLPFIERPCGILTDMSLVELGDPTHPLLHEQLRRAPATYSHSLQVASIAETAAEDIGARGLLVRVGAYFHDIGKILNPEYFTENQLAGQNAHDHLEPRMSTLILVSHVKDGIDLVRQHRVPHPIIDLVEQHHGTSLVSYFHTIAAKQNREQGYGTTLDESSFRYPGPKPQSKEAGILMLADVAESACRSLREPTPGKIEAMVRHLSEDRLKDGQFDESGLTLRELRTIENSIIKSILAMRHNRISYPNTNEQNLVDSAETKPPVAAEPIAPK